LISRLSSSAARDISSVNSSPSMATASESFIHLSRPLAPNTVGLQTNLAPLTVNIQPQVWLPAIRSLAARCLDFASDTLHLSSNITHQHVDMKQPTPLT
jgi:hypothetical protein